MKTIKCKECGEQIPSNVDSCPNCGCPAKAKRKMNVVAISICISILCIAGASFCILGNKFESNKYANDSISQDSAMQPSVAETRKVTVDSSLVVIGGMGYSVYEVESGREVTNGINLWYNVDCAKNCEGSIRYYPDKNDCDNYYDIPVVGEVAIDGGLIFKWHRDNVPYSLHIKNTHGTLNYETNNNSYDAVFTKGGKSKNIFISFEHCGEEGD